MNSLSSDRRRALRPYLDRALDLSGEARASFLSLLRSEHPVIAAELEMMLESHSTPEELRGATPSAGAAPEPALPGQTIGAFTLRTLLGRSGIGTLWLAEGSDPGGTVTAAVKLLDARVFGAQREARFHLEGRNLARLQHPNIARLIDVGVLPTGQPYLVREHVDGERIDAYCDGKKLSIEARVHLFLEVLAAVAHAHANLVVHRDLKPSNVLVDRQRQVKVVDIGIVALLETEGEAVTLAAQIPVADPAGEFAAPEQLTGGAVTTATDVYALGALLYVLLTGQHPARLITNSPAQLRSAIVDKQPVLPSVAVISGRATRPETAADTAAKRATQPKRLRTQLQGDLDAIVAKALKKAPAARYVSVDAFAEDLRRYLAHEAIGARPNSKSYRTGKFVVRHPFAVAAAGVTVALLAAGSMMLNRERGIAERRLQQSRQLANRLSEIQARFGQLPGNARRRQFIVDSSLDYLQRLALDVREDPELALEVGSTYMQLARVQLALISENLAQPDHADETLRTAERLIKYVTSDQPANRTAVLRMAQIAHDRMVLAELGAQSDGALALAGTSASWLSRYFDGGTVQPADAEQVALTLNEVADRFRSQQQFDQALSLSGRGIDVARSSDNSSLQRHLGSLLVARSRVHRDRGALDDAVVDLREAAKTLQPESEVGRDRATMYAMVLTELGHVLGAPDCVSLGRFDEATPLLQQAYKMLDRVTHHDASDSEARSLLIRAGDPLARILAQHDPKASAEVYDHLLHHLAELRGSARFRRDEARTLIASSYPVRSLGAESDARRRLDDAFLLLRELKLYPAEKVELGSEADAALRAKADLEAANGNVAHAVDTYRQLLDLVMGAKPAFEQKLTEAAQMSGLYSSLVSLYQRSGRDDLAAPLEMLRLQLWRHWDRKLPNNPFVLRQLAAAKS